MTGGKVVWLTGLPSAGKSRLAQGALAALQQRGVAACVLDGDAVRASLVPAHGYSERERADFYETLARLAALLAAQGLIVLVPATAHRRAFRERARQLAPAFLEVWLDTPAAECAARDDKGLYAASGSEHVQTLPGANLGYEPPEHPDIVAHGGADGVALEELIARALASR
jgi:adenylylsulfate kinase